MHTKPGFKIDTNIKSQNGYQNCCINPQTVHILHSKKMHELCDESIFSQELDKMNATLNAKLDFNNRDDVVFYITSEDLIKIQSSKSPVFVRLKPEQPSSKIVIPYIENITKKDIKTGGLKESEGFRPESPKSESPKSAGRSIRRLSLSTVKTSSMEHKKLTLGENPSIVISYRQNNQEFSIFLINQKGTDLVCEGLKDSDVDAFQMTSLKCITVKYTGNVNEKPIDVSVYISNINNIKFPIYFLLTTIDYVCKVQNFVEMIEEIISLAVAKEIENK